MNYAKIVILALLLFSLTLLNSLNLEFVNGDTLEAKVLKADAEKVYVQNAKTLLIIDRKLILTKIVDKKDKYQFVLCGFDTRGTVTEINQQTGEHKKRDILPHETVWARYEEIFTQKHSLVSEDYKKYLLNYTQEVYPNQYDESYVNPVGNSSKYTGQKGLNDFGKQIIQRMNQLGMIVDSSHVGEATFWDAIKTTTKPVIASHSNAYTICPVTRNLKDDQIKAVGKNGGVIHLNFFSAFVDSTFQAKNMAFRRKHKTELDA